MINRLVSQRKNLNELIMIVVDELHWIEESTRGYLLELLLSKIIYHNRLSTSQHHIQIIGMSATMSNISQIAHWLDADSYVTSFRPIGLNEYVKVDSILYDRQFVPIRHLHMSEQWNQGDSECVTEIIWNIIEQAANQNVLVFCSTKHWCEVLAKLLSKNFRRLIADKSIQPFDTIKLDDIIEQLRRTVRKRTTHE
jgi:DNA polymerase theta